MLLGVTIVDVEVGEEEEKNDVGRAIIITPRREIKDAYWAERGNGSWRKR